MIYPKTNKSQRKTSLNTFRDGFSYQTTAELNLNSGEDLLRNWPP